MTEYDWRDEYPFLKALTGWWNSEGNRLWRYHGKFQWISECTVEAKGCAEGTCKWENINLFGTGEDGQDKHVVIEAAHVARFFRSISEPSS